MLKKNFKLKISLLIIISAMLIFAAFRAAQVLFYGQYFGGAAGARVFYAFLAGMKFDFSMICVFIMPPVIFFNLPVRAKLWVKTFLIIILTVITVITGVLAADFIYMGETGRHMSEELLVIGNDAGFIIKYALTQQLVQLLFLISAFCAAVYLTIKTVNKFYAPEKYSAVKSIAVFLILAFITAAGIRGKIDGKSLGIADVYSYAATPEEAALTLNGLFVSFHTLRRGGVEFKNTKEFEPALETAREYLISRRESADTAAFPLMRRLNANGEPKKYNFFIVLLEGWGIYYIDSLGGNNFGATPAFDDIVKNGVVFENAYAVGMRSVFGFTAAFAGVPMLPNLPAPGYGLELNNFTAVGKTFARHGYYTMFTQASLSGSFRLCSLALGMLRVQECYGREHMPMLLEYEHEPSFGFDYEALMFAAEKVKDKNNFLSIVFTASTHDPYDIVYRPLENYPRDTFDGKYLNTLRYADFAVGSLIKKAKEDGWFDDTVFIFVADHTSKDPREKNLRNRYRVPFVIYAPGIFKPQRIKNTISQLDIIPTVFGMADIKDPYSAMGRSVFDKDEKTSFAFFSDGGEIGLINDCGAVMYNGKNITKTEPVCQSFDARGAADLAASLEKSASTLIKRNKWFKDVE